MPAVAGNGSTDLYLVIEGAGSWAVTVPGDLTIVGERQATQIIESAVSSAVVWFISEYMPLRFNAGYARMHLGYQILGSTWKKKQTRSRTVNADAILPNVWTGQTRVAALAARPETFGIGGAKQMTVGCNIRMKLPGYVNQQRGQVTNRTLRTITPAEGERIARRFFDNVVGMMSRVSNQTYITRDGRLRSRMAAAQSDQAAFGRFSRTTILAARRASKAEATRGIS